MCPARRAKILSIPADEKDEAGVVNHWVGFLRLFVLGVINFVCASNRFDLLFTAGENGEWVKQCNVELDCLGRVVFRIDGDEQWLHKLAVPGRVYQWR